MKGYRLNERIDLLRNRRQRRIVTTLSVVLAVLCIVAGLMVRSFDFGSLLLVKLLVMAAGCCAYIIGHEAVHGVLMWCFSHVKPTFGVSLMYAYAGSTFYFPKAPYLLIAIAPLAVWTAVLSALAFTLPADWFWPVWMVQITNVSGAAGDLFVFFHLLRKPKSVRIQDTGTSMTVWLPA